MAIDNLVQAVREQVEARFYQAGQGGAWQELDRNLQAVLSEVFAKLDLVTREEFDRQSVLLSEARVKLQSLESQLRDLEARAKPV
ncbi:MAG: accessory factor UbiK family protein [Fluviicoccus sp.]|uniref:accessory factor UbiK family protein n=1 Tax=Fluviicoccus sp. TaxID=2003552 RepID=UPI002717B999|nr:accessory factor UbiK family protein [Fluviicoccus sp.]MDO8331061.1 accessory factor UbiK family protein [Fluviicoccus sp.]